MNTKIFYKVLEKLTLGRGLPRKVNGVNVKLPGRYIRYFGSNYEPENFSFLKKSISGDSVVLDIGAHIGLFSVIAAKFAGSKGKVFAFEPTPATQKILLQTIAINHLQYSVTPVNAAMGSKTGQISFFVSQEAGDNSNSLVSYKQHSKLNSIDVQVDTIDNFVVKKGLKSVDFIKIDVEGAEFDTLKGGCHVFKTFRPRFILAIHPEPIEKKGDKLQDIYDYLVGLNYQIHYNDKHLSREAFCLNTALIDLHLTPN